MKGLRVHVVGSVDLRDEVVERLQSNSAFAGCASFEDAAVVVSTDPSSSSASVARCSSPRVYIFCYSNPEAEAPFGWLPVHRTRLGAVLDLVFDLLLRVAPGEALSLDTQLRVVRGHGGVLIPLSEGEMSILSALLAASGAYVSARELSRGVLKRTDPSGVALIWKYVSRLRRLLAEMPVAIESLPGRGYRVILHDRATTVRPSLLSKLTL